MAEIFPNEGLDLILAIVPKNGTNVGTTYAGLFTTFTASTVGTGGQTRSAYTEPSGGAYARQNILAASWAANGTGGGGANETGRVTAAGQVTFPTATAAWGTVNGFFIANSSVSAQGALYFAANFDDTTAVVLNTSDIIKVTPSWEIRN